MTQTDYETKKRECWEEFCESDKPYDVETAFDFAFDRAYALGKQKQKKPKQMCLRDRSKVCNLCHECDIDISNPRY